MNCNDLGLSFSIGYKTSVLIRYDPKSLILSIGLPGANNRETGWLA